MNRHVKKTLDHIKGFDQGGIGNEGFTDLLTQLLRRFF